MKPLKESKGMRFLGKKSRPLNEGYDANTLQNLYYEKIAALASVQGQRNLKYKFNRMSEEEKNTELSKLLLYNFPAGFNGGFLNSVISKAYGSPNWLGEINKSFHTSLDLNTLKTNLERFRGKQIVTNYEKIGKTEQANIDFINKGRASRMNAQEVEIAESSRMHIVTSFEDLYDFLTDPKNGFEGRYEENPDGTISVSMSELPIVMVRSTMGLRAFDESQPLVYIVFGPRYVENAGQAIASLAKKEVTIEAINPVYDPKEQRRLMLDYYQLVGCSLAYWWNGKTRSGESARYFSDITANGRPVEKLTSPDCILTIAPSGQCMFSYDGVDSEWEDDPAVNPGNNATVSANLPVGESYSGTSRGRRAGRLYEYESGLDPTDYDDYDDYLDDLAHECVTVYFDPEEYPGVDLDEFAESLKELDQDQWDDWCMNMQADLDVTHTMNLPVSESQRSNRASAQQRMYEAEGYTSWNGGRKKPAGASDPKPEIPEETHPMINQILDKCKNIMLQTQYAGRAFDIFNYSSREAKENGRTFTYDNSGVADDPQFEELRQEVLDNMEGYFYAAKSLLGYLARSGRVSKYEMQNLQKYFEMEPVKTWK